MKLIRLNDLRVISLLLSALPFLVGGCSTPEDKDSDEPVAAQDSGGTDSQNKVKAQSLEEEGNTASSSGDLANILNDMNNPQKPGQEQAKPDEKIATNVVNLETSVHGAGGVIAGVAGQQLEQGLPEVGSKLSYIVRKGDYLAKIAKHIYGSSKYWKEIAQLSGLENPNRIYPGDVLYYQLSGKSLAFARSYENSPREEVTVKTGDTLTSITRTIYGGKEPWRFVWRQNGQIMHPDKLEVGMKIYYLTLKTLNNIEKNQTGTSVQTSERRASAKKFAEAKSTHSVLKIALKAKPVRLVKQTSNLAKN